MGRTTLSGLSRPNIMADPSSAVRNSGRQIAWDEVPDTYRETPGFNVGVGAAGALATAEAVPVDALAGPIPAGTTLVSTTGLKTITLAADAAAGAVSLVTDPIPEDVVDADVFVYKGSGRKIIKHGNPVQPGTVDTAKVVPAVSGSGAAMGLLEGPAVETLSGEAGVAALTGYGVIVGGAVFRDLVPNLDGTIEAELKSNGMGFVFEDYANSQAS